MPQIVGKRFFRFRLSDCDDDWDDDRNDGGTESRTSRMIIGHCIHGLGLGGAQQVIAAIAKNRSEDFEHIVYSCEDGVLAESVRNAGAEVRIVPRRIPKFDPFWVSGLAKWMRKDRIDVVHTHLFGDTLHGLLAAQRLGLVGIATMHTVPEGLTTIQRVGYRWLLPKAFRTVACSRSVSQAFAEDEPSLSERIVTIPNGVDLTLASYSDEEKRSARVELGVPADGVLLACVGRLHPQKAFHEVIDAFAKLADSLPQASLLMIGEGELRGDLESQVKSHGLSNQIIFLGARSDIGGLLPLIDIVVFASPYEGLPMAMLEAMSAGLCVLGADIDSLRDVLVSGEDAWLVPPERLAEGLRQVIEDGPLRERLGNGAKEKHRRSFSGQQMVAAYESLYREALASQVR